MCGHGVNSWKRKEKEKTPTAAQQQQQQQPKMIALSLGFQFICICYAMAHEHNIYASSSSPWDGLRRSTNRSQQSNNAKSMRKQISYVACHACMQCHSVLLFFRYSLFLINILSIFLSDYLDFFHSFWKNGEEKSAVKHFIMCTFLLVGIAVLNAFGLGGFFPPSFLTSFRFAFFPQSYIYIYIYFLFHSISLHQVNWKLLHIY